MTRIGLLQPDLVRLILDLVFDLLLIGVFGFRPPDSPGGAHVLAFIDAVPVRSGIDGLASDDSRCREAMPSAVGRVQRLLVSPLRRNVLSHLHSFDATTRNAVVVELQPFNESNRTMAKKNLAQIQAQIDKLTREAEAIRAKEVAAVVQRIKGEIAEFGLTAADLGFGAGRGPVRKTRAAAVKTQTQAPAVKGAKVKSTAVKSAKKATPTELPVKAAKRAAGKAAAKAHGVIKYADDQGHTWTGVGKRPGWFLAALAAGQTADDLRVTSAAA